MSDKARAPPRGMPITQVGDLLATGKRTQSEIARAILMETRNPSSVSRRMRRESFRTRDPVRAGTKRQVTRELVRAGGERELWFLSLDGLASQRGSLTKVENAIQYKARSISSTRGREGGTGPGG